MLKDFLNTEVCLVGHLQNLVIIPLLEFVA